MGTLVPPWYQEMPTSQGGLLVAAFFFGSSTAAALFDSTKAARHTYRSWRRSPRAMTYVGMLWAVIATCIITSLCSWLFLLGIIPPRCVVCRSHTFLIGFRLSFPPSPGIF